MSQSRSELESKAIFSAQQHIWHICEFMEKMMVDLPEFDDHTTVCVLALRIPTLS